MQLYSGLGLAAVKCVLVKVTKTPFSLNSGNCSKVKTSKAITSDNDIKPIEE